MCVYDFILEGGGAIGSSALARDRVAAAVGELACDGRDSEAGTLVLCATAAAADEWARALEARLGPGEVLRHVTRQKARPDFGAASVVVATSGPARK